MNTQPDQELFNILEHFEDCIRGVYQGSEEYDIICARDAINRLITQAKEQVDTSKVNRLEVINHYNGEGRQLVSWHDDQKVELSFQDDGRTLKVFIDRIAQLKEEL